MTLAAQRRGSVAALLSAALLCVSSSVFDLSLGEGRARRIPSNSTATPQQKAKQAISSRCEEC